MGAASTVLSESSVIESCRSELAALLEPYPRFADLLDDIDPYVCPRAELVAAISDAPHVALRQSLFSVFLFREVLALVTGRQFS